ncbi:MAG TPA: hypothetical protein VGO47_03420 [Chlamydiales bacterium]|nr:hypothetical protein [Chlamydiales bacterium]
MNYTQDLVFHGIPAVYRHLPPVRRRTATSAMSGPSDPYIPLSIRHFKVSETSTVPSAPSEQVQETQASEEGSLEVRKVVPKKRKVLPPTRVRNASSKPSVAADKKKRQVTPVRVEDSENAASPDSDVQPPASAVSPPAEASIFVIVHYELYLTETF